MSDRFDYFVIFAGMRTGSNYLESSLNGFDEITCLGEVFNPHFVGGPKKKDLFGIDLKARESDPFALLEKVKLHSGGISGFRFFHDHDPRILAASLKDVRCAKIVLSRNLLDSYISHEIARKTNQWRLGKMQDARSAKVDFAKDRYLQHVENNQNFEKTVTHALQKSGQTSFAVSYGDLSNAEVLNGMAKFLGASETRKKASAKTKKQNPGSLKDKVSNYDEMVGALSGLLTDSMEKVPVFEAPRGAAIPTYISAPTSPVLFMPVQSGPTGSVRKWLADLDGVPEWSGGDPFNQKSLRKWKRNSKGHYSFTVIRHPVSRLYDAYVRRILLPGEQAFSTIRNALQSRFDVPLPAYESISDLSVDGHRSGFLAFAKFILGNLNGQTSIRVDAAWASQVEVLRGMSEFCAPDFVLREHELSQGLGYIADRLDKKSPELVTSEFDIPVSLDQIYDAEIEAAVRACYQRDYMMFGFRAWDK